MADQPPDSPANSSPDPHTPHEQPHGYFNQAQLEDIKTAEDLLGPAGSAAHAARLLKCGIAAEYVAGLAATVADARQKTTATGQARGTRRAASLNAKGPARALITVLQGIQSAAKQKQRMAEEDDDPTTNFSTDGYFIGKRLNPNRATLLQNADALLAHARNDALPGIDAAEITAIENAIAAYRGAKEDEAGKEEAAERERVERDALIKRINARRMAIQHAADRAYPYTDEANAPARRAFKLPTDRPFNG